MTASSAGSDASPHPGLSETGTITHVQRFSTHDGPGIRTTVFLKGCPLSCPWCHNPENQAPDRELLVHRGRCIGCGVCVDVCPQDGVRLTDGGPTIRRGRCTACGLCAETCYAEALVMAGRRTSAGALIQELEEDRAFYDTSGGGVTFSGGEPLAQPAFLGALLQACRARGIHTAVDTCGFASWSVVDRVRNTVDLFLYDVKLVDEPRHERYTGVSNQLILSNLERLSELGHALVLRFPLIPGVNDQPADIAEVAALAAGLPSLRRVDLLPYHRMAADKYTGLGRTYDLADLRPPTQQKVAEAAELLKQAGLSVQVGG